MNRCLRGRRILKFLVLYNRGISIESAIKSWIAATTLPPMDTGLLECPYLMVGSIELTDRKTQALAQLAGRKRLKRLANAWVCSRWNYARES